MHIPYILIHLGGGTGVGKRAIKRRASGNSTKAHGNENKESKTGKTGMMKETWEKQVWWNKQEKTHWNIKKAPFLLVFLHFFLPSFLYSLLKACIYYIYNWFICMIASMIYSFQGGRSQRNVDGWRCGRKTQEKSEFMKIITNVWKFHILFYNWANWTPWWTPPFRGLHR